MKATELIKELQRHVDIYGDREIYIEGLSDCGDYFNICNIKPMNEIYTGIWDPVTKSNFVKEKIFLLGQNGYGEFSND